MKSKLKILFGALLMLLFGIALTAFGVISIQKALASKSWPTTEGKVTSSDVSSERDSDGKTMYKAEVRYAYTVNGSSYESDKIAMFSSSSSSSGMEQRKAGKYPVGATVQVRYNPSSPGTAVLEAGLQVVHWLLMVFGILLDLAGIGAFMGLFKPASAMPPAAAAPPTGTTPA